MSPEFCIIAGIVLGLLFTELTGLSPGGIIVPGYIALFFTHPLEIVLTGLTAACVMLSVALVSRFFYLFGRRRYALCIILGILFKTGIEYLLPFVFPETAAAVGIGSVRLIGWLIPGIIANDMYKQGIPRTLLSAAAVGSLVFLLGLGLGFALK